MPDEHAITHPPLPLISNSTQFLRAKNRLEAQDFRLAALQMSHLVKDRPEDKLYWTIYADALEGLAESGDYARGTRMKDVDGNTMLPENLWEYALKARRKAIETGDSTPQAWGQLATTLIKMNCSAEALEILDEQLRHNPDDVIVYDQKARALMVLGRYEEALQAISKVREMEPDNNSAQWLEKRIENWVISKGHKRELSEQDGRSVQDEILELYEEYDLVHQVRCSANDHTGRRRA